MAGYGLGRPVAGVVGALCLVAALPEAGAAAEACARAFEPLGRVAGSAGGADLKLEDGRVLRLASIAADFRMDGHAEALATALAELATGRRVAVAPANPKPDRYGRLSGLVRVEGEATLQQSLLELGLAAVLPESGDDETCTSTLVVAEEGARAARIGIWERLPLDARDVEAVRGEIGRFTVVEGRIFAAGSGGNNAYLNFGRVWREDVTVRIPEDARPALVAAGLDPDGMAGASVLVRGVVEEAGGPLIEVRRREQIRLER